MANLPVQRSYNQIVGDLISAFLSEYGITSVKVGGPVLSLFEAVGQSQFRNSGDIFTLLTAASLDFAEKDALEAIGNSEGVPKQKQSPAYGSVTVTDTSFTKIASTIYQGTAAPIVGTTSINIVDGTAFPASGSIYIGRGTTNYEGPLAYTSIVNNGPYWTITLATGTQKFHNLTETVVLAQGGSRVVSAGAIVQTAITSTVAAIQFKTLYSATIQDGETTLTGLTVVALNPGLGGNIAKGAIKSFSSVPFTGATVTNPTSFNNGRATEDDDTYRERIRSARQSKAKGTPLAIKTAAVGIISPDDNKRVLSAALVTAENKPVTLYIDDGTGYEEISTGVAIESVIDSAFGGETDLRLSSDPPVTKAQIVSTIAAPFTLTSGATLAFSVGGSVTEHSFNTDEFRSIGNATAYEVVASINNNPDLLWSARTLGGGTYVVVFAKSDTNESIQNVAVASNDANTYFGFTSTKVDTLKLYKNDRLLSKDGAAATVSSTNFSTWGLISGAQTLVLAVDGVKMSFDGSTFASFTDTDFVTASTGYSTVGNNSLAAWAAVFNLRIPGITAAVNNGVITITSNRGKSATASVQIISGTLVTTIGMFAAQTVTGANADYSLNRNTGELELAIALAAGDSLSAGSLSTRAFIQNSPHSTVTLSSNGNFWLSVDGGVSIISTGVSSTSGMDISSTTKSWGYRVRIASHAGSSVFSNVAVGDWAICWDPVLISAGLNGGYRVAAIDTSASSWIEVETAAAITPATNTTFTKNGFTIARSTNQLQHITVPSATNYTASSLQSTLAALVKGATPSVYKTNSLRIATNTFASTGDIALVAADTSAQLLTFLASNAVANTTGHLASVESTASDLGTPDFHTGKVVSATSTSALTISWSTDPSSVETTPSVSGNLVGLRAIDDGTTDSLTRYSTNKGFHSHLASVAANSSNWDVTVRTGVETAWVPQDRLYIARALGLSYLDSLVVVVDNDTTAKRFTIPMGRKLKPVSTTYASSNDFVDADNSNQSIAVGFGLNYTFNDYAVYMAARTKTHDLADSTHYTVAPTDTSRTILWRYRRLGQDGNKATIKYTLPIAPSAALAVLVDNTTDGTSAISVRLASGAPRTGYSIRSTTKIGTSYVAGGGGAQYDVRYILGFTVTNWSRTSNVTTITLDTTTPGVGTSGHGIAVGSSIYVKSNDPSFTSGVYVVTATTSNTIQYSDTASNATSTTAGTVSFDTQEATLSGSAVQVGDYFRVESTSGLPTAFVGQTMRIAAFGNQYIAGKLDMIGVTPPTINTISWNPLNNTSAFEIFQNANQSASTIAAAVNTLATASASVPVTATVIGTGTGTIVESSSEEDNNPTVVFNLTDGINYVSTTTAPGSVAGNYTLAFKNSITSTLATNSDWANETIYVVPRSVKNLVSWLNTPTISGLFSVAEIVASSTASKLQISSLTAGSQGSIQVQGGNANTATASIVGSTQTCSSATNFIVSTITAANATPLNAGMYVRIDNSSKLAKSCIDSNTKLDSFTLSGSTVTVTLDNTGTAIYTATGAAQASVGLLVEKQGGFLTLTDTGLANAAATFSGVGEGDWIRITTPVSAMLSASRQIAAANTGIYKVVRVVAPGLSHAGTIWIENASGVEQGVGEADLAFFTADSLMPGDTVSISAPLWLTANFGTWKVTSVGDAGSGQFTNRYTFKLDATGKTPTNISSPVGALGSQSTLVLPIEAAPGRWFKRIHSVTPNQSSATLTDIKFTSAAGASKINATAGSTLTALDKLGFPTSIASGIDGYQHSVGLIGETNKVLYGDPSDPATYPGVIAAGAKVNISGTLVRRIQISMLLRVRSGAPTKAIADEVRSAVAAVINAKGTGESVPLQQLTAAAGDVGGVVSATMLDPLAQTGSDLIQVQPYERPIILNPDDDILISFVGQ